MPRTSNKNMPGVMWGTLYTDDEKTTGIVCGSEKWFIWLSSTSRFNFLDQSGTFTARAEKRRNGTFWYAFRTIGGKTYKTYLGASANLTVEAMRSAASKLSEKAH